MEIFKTKASLQAYLQEARSTGQKIALIPTMGALHEGHLSLLNYAKPISDIRVCSIFVNPTQFNDPKDLEKYPRPIENDIRLLESVDCDILFLPSVDEMYPDKNEAWHLDLGELDQIWEGERRPGHFQGVTQVVYKLFTLVQPDIACFGQKDFQQVMVIKRMIAMKDLAIQLAICPIIRDQDGLALSSRNARLSDAGKRTALALSRSLQYVKDHIHDAIPLAEIKDKALQILTDTEGLTVEYFALCESSTLKEVNHIDFSKQHVALVAAWVEGVRLIDNMILNNLSN
ncbi:MULTISPECIES: pantoate--beta-alanine ligase [Sphingobacterium]|uniref:pantoate--beta-alanine ligase n=1 Tax=Sphingobacterium TaxID=28453 RepID=UPI000E9119B3|nr:MULTISPECIES: pantoate--beta-alanine ligase [Sphingobacterium]HAL52003.1 pantoate--beta-alanine ligase [Sphingobacterium sp.]QQT64166.1 pantoate--beta-alanine ligase [Sphingobacterium multivorum]HAT92297.1 pantoate--beta-alanine ligase [Sphingobacterium sp.]HAU54202.1 pantoate--beta-alanine ligase [Sphingobacterium sp.]HCX55385.1 pantoate--beta-alanine ligase [Sphingobacterium sp.]